MSHCKPDSVYWKVSAFGVFEIERSVGFFTGCSRGIVKPKVCSLTATRKRRMRVLGNGQTQVGASQTSRFAPSTKKVIKNNRSPEWECAFGDWIKSVRLCEIKDQKIRSSLCGRCWGNRSRNSYSLCRKKETLAGGKRWYWAISIRLFEFNKWWAGFYPVVHKRGSEGQLP